MEYKRLTEKNDLYWALQETKLSAEVGIYLTDCLNRLAELEDKIEQGTIIEFPRMFKAIDGVGWIVEFIDESGCVCRSYFFHEEKAIKRLKELQNGLK